MQFKVPQFLDIEDKIFGPFTFREFVYLAGGIGLGYVLYELLGFFWGALPILAVAGLSLALIFYRPNNKPFIYMIESGVSYLLKDKLYIWKRRQSKVNENKQPIETFAGVQKREILENTVRLGGNKLRDLAWSLDVLDLKK